MNVIIIISVIVLLFGAFNYDKKISYKVMSEGKNNFKKYYWNGVLNEEE